MPIRKSENPAATFFLTAAYITVALLIGFVEGTKFRQCPARTEDGRALLGQTLRTGECRYAPPPARPFDLHTPAELRTIATIRERMERVRAQTKRIPRQEHQK